MEPEHKLSEDGGAVVIPTAPTRKVKLEEVILGAQLPPITQRYKYALSVELVIILIVEVETPEYVALLLKTLQLMPPFVDTSQV